MVGCTTRTADWVDGEGYRKWPLSIERGSVGFEQLLAPKTGLTARNEVSEDTMVANRHFMHGSGIAIGDVDNDSWPDIYVARLTAPDLLYRNLGDWRFEDITLQSGLPATSSPSTGAVLVDIDGDRDLDLLVTMLTGPNAAFLNDGRGQFKRVPAAAGIESNLAGTTMTLADVDGDADLDLYVARYKRISLADSLPPEVLTWESVMADSAWQVKPEFATHYAFEKAGTGVIRSELGEPDALYLNNGRGTFEFEPWTDGRFLNAEGQKITESPRHWGLTARFHDVNGDRIPDLYVCNDFNSPDAFFLGQESGKLRQVPPEAVRKTSNATMSVDFSDVDRDGHMDFFMTDMHSRDYHMRQRQRNTRIPVEPSPGDLSFVPQEMQNMLMLGRGDDTWAEITNLAGVAASDWSWATTFLDVDLDGFEDILVTTGHVFDIQDLDAQAEEERRSRQTRSWQQARRLVLDFPSLALPNAVFRNRGDLTFEDMPRGWGFGATSDVAHGMALGDLDQDGDLDVVTNRLNDTPGVYRNSGGAGRLAVRLQGDAPNTSGVGALVKVSCPGLPAQQKEITAGGMYLSGSQMQVAFAATKESCRIEVDWRAGKRSVIPNAERNHIYEIHESAALPVPAEPSERAHPMLFALEASYPAAVDMVYDDFARQPLLPWRLSRYSPAVATYDVDKDSLDDVIIGGGQGGRTIIYGSRTGPIELDILPGEVTSLAAVSTQAGQTRVFAASSNYERGLADAADSSWIFIYDVSANGTWTRYLRLLFGRSTPGPLSLFDADADGDLDVFAGGQFVPGRYPEPASSQIYLNENGQYVASVSQSRVFQNADNVRSSAFGDLDGDGDLDAVLGLEWGPARVFMREGRSFVDRTQELGLVNYTGWWRGVALGDFDADGRLDIAAANAGWNTRYGHSGHIRLNYADLDANGILDIIESFALDQRFAPARDATDLATAIPPLSLRFNSHREFSFSQTSDLWPDLDRVTRIREATSLGSAVFLNKGDRFVMHPLPVEAQFTTATSVVVLDANMDGHEDVVLGQNWFAFPLSTPRQDAGRTQLLLGTGTGTFDAVDGGFRVYGEARGLATGDYNGDGRPDVIVTQHGAPAHVYHNQTTNDGLQVVLNSASGASGAVAASVRVEYADGDFGPVRVVPHGSQNASRVIMGLRAQPARIHVNWTGGRRTSYEVASGQRRIVIRYDE